MVNKDSAPLVSIVILNWNGLEDTKLCLEHAHSLDYPNFEIIVVDNGSSQSDKKYLSGLRDIKYVDNVVNRGFAGGQADGYKHAKGDFILLLNNDAIIAENYLSKALPLFDDPEVAVVGGRSYFWDDKNPILNKSNSFYSYMDIDPISAVTTMRTQDFGVIQEVNTVSGSAALVRRTTIEDVGYLWEPFFAYYEETDLFARIKRRGYKILYSPDLHIWHKNGASSGAQGGSLFFFYHIFRNRYMYAMRNFDDNYFKLFKKNYYKHAYESLLKIFTSPAHRRYAQGYIKAICDVQLNRKVLLKSRDQLKMDALREGYNSQIIAEQLRLSLVIDATSATQKKVNKLLADLPKSENPLHEYVIVVREDAQATNLPRNIRLIIDRGMFETHPANLGGVVASGEWLVIATPESILSANSYVQEITECFSENPDVIEHGADSLIVKKQFFDFMGGLPASAASLSENIKFAINYAFTRGGLRSDTPPTLTGEEIDVLENQSKLDSALSGIGDTHHVKWYRRNTRLANFIYWFIIPTISFRRKAGRAKNLVLSILSLNKERLKRELRYMREEIYAEDMKKKNSSFARLLKKRSEIFTKEQVSNLSNIPVFIVCYERVNDLRILVKKLEKIGSHKIVFIDNGSTYLPLLEYLNSSPYQVLPLGRNVGHTAPWSLNIIRVLIPYGYYIVTDPDVIPTDKCIANNPIERLFEIHKQYPDYQKVGLGLKIDDLPDHYPLKSSVIDWERQFWKTKLDDGVFAAGVDTTFALYKPGTFSYILHPSIRTGEPFTARHMPWYGDPINRSEEDVYYKLRADSNITSWNSDELPERYKEELNNAK